jgi:hypothetical protein
MPKELGTRQRNHRFASFIYSMLAGTIISLYSMLAGTVIFKKSQVRLICSMLAGTIISNFGY